MTKIYRITLTKQGMKNPSIVERLNTYCPTITGSLWECDLTDEQYSEIQRLYCRPAQEMVLIELIAPTAK